MVNRKWVKRGLFSSCIQPPEGARIAFCELSYRPSLCTVVLTKVKPDSSNNYTKVILLGLWSNKFQGEKLMCFWKWSFYNFVPQIPILCVFAFPPKWTFLQLFGLVYSLSWLTSSKWDHILTEIGWVGKCCFFFNLSCPVAFLQVQALLRNWWEDPTELHGGSIPGSERPGGERGFVDKIPHCWWKLSPVPVLHHILWLCHRATLANVTKKFWPWYFRSSGCGMHWCHEALNVIF